MAPPTLRLPPRLDPAAALPELPAELLLHLHQQPDRDALDAFVLAGPTADDEEELNQLIGAESSLPHTALVSHLLRQQIQATRLHVGELKHKLALDQEGENMEVLSGYVGDLLTQVTLIRDAATESEMVVREITRDIQSLDLAKKNLIASMNALKRFQMLVNAFDQLTTLASSRRYRETAQALSAVKQLSQFFQSFSNVERVSVVRQGVSQVMTVLRGQVLGEFTEAFASESSRAGKNALLTDACLVVDGLGEDAKTALLSWYSAHSLRDYRTVFGSASEAGQLDNIARRFAWFRRVLQSHEMDNGALFPRSWNVGAVLAGGFTEVTRDDLQAVLAKSASSMQVSLLLEALQQTTEFEAQMVRKFSMPFESIAAMSAISSGRASAAGLISVIFEPYLGVVVDAQDRALAEMIGAFTSSRISISPSDNPSSVLPSSTELFYFYREALERVAGLSAGKPLLDLSGVYRKWLRVYAEEVLAGALVKYERRSAEARPNVDELQTACLVLNTAEYCLETASQLEERLILKISPPLKASISFAQEKELFLTTISSSILSILRELESTLDVPFGQMSRLPWKDAEIVSSESVYVVELVRGINTVVGVVRESVELKKYTRSICDKIVGLVLAKFTQTVVRCRPLAQTAAEQLLLDLASIKTCLLRLLLAPGDTAPVPISYSRYVAKSVLKVDTLLKVVMTPEEPAEEFVKHFLLLIPCQSFSDFQKVLDLKGVRRTDQNTLLDIFLARTSTAANLADTSILTNLSMDPNASQSLMSPPSSGFNSPLTQSMSQNSNLNIFASFAGGSNASLPMLPAGSRDGSRAGSSASRTGEDRGKEALLRLGARIGLSTRMFSGRERD